MEKYLKIFKIKDLRIKVLTVAFLLVCFRVLSAIPIPGVDKMRLEEFFGSNQLFSFVGIMAGGVLDNLSIIMLGVGPYITASIIMQLLTMLFPRLKEMYQEEGEAGRTRFNQYARILTVPLGLLQSYALLILLIRNQVIPDLSLFGFAVNMIIATAGTVFLMWLGELITEKGLGNGVSMIIFAGIVSSLPTGVSRFVATWDPSQ